ncbi:estradiol 17-beta-dehydrogenase 11-like isoform X1 [Vanessa tameamea]|uniref:Short-chain dehydrogenase/reductase 3 n=2 Tax=Vanessa tameamea TaxID=334116 RepID=A0A8B8ILT7_VANTA|nr:estradiol 17-beta-dehydrogenase 11-like isoform X1 [Vanessa tameamea]XP_026498062.1 estradiol 17-beta-dehydrogenase 11-like isoform X1 [Vanessa tameamea]XP_026498063.1 estradiol 17-beta-dehydrogenase 11-like isoform X1 [Vanessa tameamea]
MASVETHKNGTAQNLLSKAPWTDEQGISMKIYQGVVLTLEVIVLIVKMYATWFYSIYKFFVPPEPKSVKGEIILITGAGHGMGREMALSFAKLGGTIVCVDINSTGNQETVEMIKDSKGKAHSYLCDVTSRTSINEMAEKIRKEVGEVTILINNAGIMPCKPLLQTGEKEIRTAFEVNCLAHLWTLQAFLPGMMERNHGHIVAMSSMAGVIGLRNLVPYCGTKFAVRGMMEAVHEELREDPRDFSGIKLTCICPYIVDTGLCKNPKIKFPSLMKILSPQEAVEHIVDAVRREYHEITIPSSLYYINQMFRVFPRSVPLHIKDFLDSGLEAQ